LLPNFACFGFNCKVRHYIKVVTDAIFAKHGTGGAAQVDPGFSAVDPALAFKR